MNVLKRCIYGISIVSLVSMNIQCKNDKKVEDKQEMLDKIKELSFQIYEDVVQKIRSIGKKYEAE